MDELGLDTGGAPEPAVDLVPGRRMRSGDRERLTDRRRMSEQPDEADGEVVAVGQGPLGGAVAVHDDRLPGPHPRDVGPAAGGRDEGLVVGVRRPDDGRGEPVVAVRRDQQILAGDLVAGVLPVRVPQRCGLGDREPGGRLLVRGGRADEDVLPAAVAEPFDVGRDDIGGEGAELGDDIELLTAQGLVDGGLIAGIGVQGLAPRSAASAGSTGRG